MKVNLIYSPDVHPQLMDSILEILSSVSGPVEFSVIHMQWNYNHLYKVQQHRYRNDFRFKIESEYKLQEYKQALGYPLSWRELFFLCQQARKRENFPPEDFVILITNRRNSMNFFSMFDINGDRNAFIQSSDWDYFLKAPESFPVAYEVVANILRILMKFNLSDKMEENFHLDSIGCVNDFCENKGQIILKLRTADICPDCLKRLEDHHADPQIVMQALSIFEKIRINLKFSQGLAGNIKPKKLSVKDDGKIFVDNKELNLTPLEKAIFIFFLSKPDGIRLVELDHYEAEIFAYYQLLKSNADPENIRKLVDNVEGNFSYNKSRLNKKLRDQIGEPLANFYRIDGVPGENFSVALPSELISFDEKFRFS